MPEGMKRVGYDADTSKYYYRDADGTLWEGPAGAQYGELTQGALPFRPLPPPAVVLIDYQ